MKVKQDIGTGKVIVTYISTHWNHKKQLAYLPVPISIKLNIASRLQQGATIQSVLDWIRDQECEKLGVLVNPEQCVFSLPVTKKFSPNALQLQFYPTKRKQERTQSCTKPTLEEVESTQ